MTINDDVYNVHDVGGARSERKKWVHSFQAVDCVVFTVGLSDYNVDWYDGTNSLEESLELFKSLLALEWFTKSAFFLVFTKIDLFEEKLKHEPMKTYFPDYNGGSDLSHGLEYWTQRFNDIKPDPKSQLHIQYANNTASFRDMIMTMHERMPQQLSLARTQHDNRKPTTGPTKHVRHDSSQGNGVKSLGSQPVDTPSTRSRRLVKASSASEEEESDSLLTQFKLELLDSGITSTTSLEISRSRPGVL